MTVPRPFHVSLRLRLLTSGAAAILGLATAVAPWLSALIVAVVLFAVAGVAALMGKKQVQQATPPTPEAAIESVQTDIEEVKERAGRG